MNRRVIAALIAGLLAGVVATLVVVAASGSSDDPTPSTEECDEADSVVAAANANLEQIAATEGPQGVTYFAAVLAEQRAVVYTMEVLPGCFTLADRAGAQGLLDGVRALMSAAERPSGAAPIGTFPASSDPPEPADDAPDDPAPPVSDPGSGE